MIKYIILKNICVMNVDNTLSNKHNNNPTKSNNLLYK